MAERNWYDDVMGFFGQDARSVIGGRQEDPVTGKVQAGFGDFLAGRSQAELDSAYDQMKTTQRRKKGKTALEESGYTASELGLDPDKTSRGAVTSSIRRLEEGKADDKSETAFQRSLKPIELQMQQQDKTRQAELSLAREKLSQSNQLALLQLADSKDSRIAELQYQKLRDRKADMQYNERMEQLDRKDRRQAMQSLAAGLASLGAAFAL
jgi:hypothetical protein